MNILITNDDGIHAEGLRYLCRELSALGRVYVVAPAEERSGAGHGVTVTQPLYAQTQELDDVAAAWTVTGTPVDCIKMAMEVLLPVRPDVVVSGVNHGPNLGTDTLYSGTVAAALEGNLYHLPAIAISVTGWNRRFRQPGNLAMAAKVTAWYCRELCEFSGAPLLLNINVPGAAGEKPAGIRYAGLGWRWYKNAIATDRDAAGNTCYWVSGQIVDGVADGTTDVELAAAGYVTVTPLQYNMTDRQALQELTGGAIALPQL